MYHRTRVNKISGLSSHVVVLSQRRLPAITEIGAWFVINTENSSFDKEEGRRVNEQILYAYLKKNS